MKILVTGHNGFKGSWLSIMLKLKGHEVHGISLPPTKGGIFELANVRRICDADVNLDIRHIDELNLKFQEINPEIVFHMAAQPLVLNSYERVFETFSTNVTGTLNVLNASQQSRNIRAIVVVTTDKVYLNDGKRKIFQETDALGGDDPYSSSKAIADLLTQNWSKNFTSVPIGIARAGNVMGGGDNAANRLIPDLFRSIGNLEKPKIRNPQAVRPWQHVLDCLSGYIKFMEYLLENGSEILNFGPDLRVTHSVQSVVERFMGQFGLDNWELDLADHRKEAEFLMLDSSKAKSLLNWGNKLDWQQSVDITADWFKASRDGRDMFDYSEEQVSKFLQL